jgi:hypothetical protein
MWIGADSLLVRFVQTWKVLLDEHVQTRRRRGLDAYLLTFGPFRDDMCGRRYANRVVIEMGGDGMGESRHFQQIDQAAPWRKFNERFDTPAVVQLSHLVLRQAQAQRVSLNA